jgi:hypothetical protein
MQQIYNNLFESLPETSRVWVYQSQTKLTEEQQTAIQDKLNLFMATWAAHGDQLFGASTILEDYFVVISVDESKTIASGCSIDSSIRFMKDLGKEFDLDFFNRLNVLIEENNEKKIVHFSEINQHKGAKYFNPQIANLGDFRKNWQKIIE